MVYCTYGFVDLKDRATDSGVKTLALETEELQGLSLKFLDDDVVNYSTISFHYFHFSSKICF